MNVGVIGSGMIGATVARLFTRAGHEVAIANSRGPASLQELVEELGPSARAGSIEEVARFGDVAVVAIPLGAYRDLPRSAFEGSIVVDANNCYPGRDGAIEALDEDRTSSSELLANHLEGARVVKAFNTMYYATLAIEGRPDAAREDRLALFLAGDDPEAKQLVAGLIQQLGFAPVDTGSLADGGRRQQPGSAVYNTPMRSERAEACVAEGNT